MGIFKFLGSVVSGGGEEEDKYAFTSFATAVEKPINSAVIVILAIIGAAAIAFAIYVGFRLAKAEDEGKRKEAKQQLLWSIIAIIVTVSMAVLLQTVFNSETGVFGTQKPITLDPSESQDATVLSAGTNVITAVNASVTAILKLASLGGMIFAIYVGTRLAMAQDEGKRKEAKAQLLWTLIAIVAAIALSMIISTTMVTIANSL